MPTTEDRRKSHRERCLGLLFFFKYLHFFQIYKYNHYSLAFSTVGTPDYIAPEVLRW